MIDDRGPGTRVQTGSVDEQMGSVSPSLHTPTRVDVGLTLHSAWIGPSETWDGIMAGLTARAACEAKVKPIIFYRSLGGPKSRSLSTTGHPIKSK